MVQKKPSKLLKYLEIIVCCILICSAIWGVMAWAGKPHAEKFVKDMCKIEQEKLYKKMDSLITISENHRRQTRNDVTRIIFVLIKTIPKKDRLDALQEYKELFPNDEPK